MKLYKQKFLPKLNRNCLLLMFHCFVFICELNLCCVSFYFSSFHSESFWGMSVFGNGGGGNLMLLGWENNTWYIYGSRVNKA